MLPELHVEAIHALIVQRYNIKGSIKQVAGYSDLNYLIKDNSLPPQKYIFKISCADEDEIFLNIQTYVLLRIGELRKDLNLGFPEIVKTVHGEDCLVIQAKHYKNYARLLKYVQGKDLWEVEEPSEKLLTDIGVMTAQLSVFLAKITLHQEIQDLVKQIDMEHDPESLLSFPKKYREDRHHLEAEVKEEVRKVLKEFKMFLPKIRQLPFQLIHNDICKSNLLVEDRGGDHRLCGLIDFGDLDYSYSLVELATVAGEINVDPQKPLRNAMLVIRGYNSVMRLNETEKELLFPLMKARIAAMTLMVYRDCYYTPDSEYLLKNKADSVKYLNIFSKITNQEFQKQLEQHLL